MPNPNPPPALARGPVLSTAVFALVAGLTAGRLSLQQPLADIAASPCAGRRSRRSLAGRPARGGTANLCDRSNVYMSSSRLDHARRRCEHRRVPQHQVPIVPARILLMVGLALLCAYLWTERERAEQAGIDGRTRPSAARAGRRRGWRLPRLRRGQTSSLAHKPPSMNELIPPSRFSPRPPRSGDPDHVACPDCDGDGRNPEAPDAIADDEGTCLTCAFPHHPLYVAFAGCVRCTPKPTE